jgi:hypothetical protein
MSISYRPELHRFYLGKENLNQDSASVPENIRSETMITSGKPKEFGRECCFDDAVGKESAQYRQTGPSLEKGYKI